MTRPARQVVVLDDDPTGTQTVHGVPVLTRWAVPELVEELRRAPKALYILTNSRALPPAQAERLAREVGGHLREAARQSGRELAVVSRADSTLRGHFPGELAALQEGLGEPCDAWVLMPYFEAGGRVTLNDVHYLRRGETLVPVGDTEYARDPAFGYRASNLRAWVEEKTLGEVRAADVASIALEDIRGGYTLKRLLAVPRGGVVVVNAERPGDLALFVRGVLAAEEQGRRYLYRTAASFAAARAGLHGRPLSGADLALPSGGVLTVVGSYVPASGEQLGRVLALPGTCGVELDVGALLSINAHAEVERAVKAVDFALRNGQDAVLFTSRTLVRSDGAQESLTTGARVSAGLTAVVRGLAARPRALIAKGGITSSDVATAGLGVRRAEVLGQLAPGVSVWRLGPESRWPGLAYVVFPGNVGGPDALAEVLCTVRA